VPMSNTISILVVSDVVSREVYNQQIRELFSGVSLVLSCGDLPYDYLEYIVTMLDVPLLYVHGNHDRPLRTDHSEIPAPRGCIWVEGRILAEQGLLIAGLGGSIRYKPIGAHQYTEWEMRKRVGRLAPRFWWNRLRGRRLDIFLAHAPPRGIHDEEDFAHHGFETFRSLIERQRPRYFIHGHTQPHAGVPQVTRLGETEVIHINGWRVLEVCIGQD
jgi:uncharacterized protein